MGNCLATHKTLKNNKGEEICWNYITKLHRLQEEEGLHAGTRLRKRHVDKWNKNKMSTRLPCDTLSTRVADSIDWAREDLKHPDFAGSEPTTEFITATDLLFDAFNSRSLFGRFSKAPLSRKTLVSGDHFWSLLSCIFRA